MEAQLQISEQARDLVASIDDLATAADKLEAIEYAIKLLATLKAELNG